MTTTPAPGQHDALTPDGTSATTDAPRNVPTVVSRWAAICALGCMPVLQTVWVMAQAFFTVVGVLLALVAIVAGHVGRRVGRRVGVGRGEAALWIAVGWIELLVLVVVNALLLGLAVLFGLVMSA